MPTPVVRSPEAYLYKSSSADVLVKTGEGFIYGVLVTASTGGSIKLWDNTTGSGTVILDTMAVLAGDFVPCPVEFTTGLYLDVTGTVTVTVFYI